MEKKRNLDRWRRILLRAAPPRFEIPPESARVLPADEADRIAREEREFVDRELRKLIHYWLGLVLLLGAFLFLFLGVMDYFVAPEFFSRFLGLRIGITLVLLGCFAANRVLQKRGAGRKALYAVVFTGVVGSGITVEAMLFQLGGHASGYYAGLNLLSICTLGLIPLGVRFSAFLVCIIYGIYLLPILFLDTITSPRIFLENQFFLVSTFIVTLIWRTFAQRLTRQSLRLRFRTLRDKKEIEHYSEKLEELVRERTRELRASERMFRELFEQANDGIMLLRPDGRILDVNSRACEIHGCEKEDLIGKNLQALVPEEERSLHSERFRRLSSGEALLYESHPERPDGTRLSVDVSATRIRIDGQPLILALLRDVTEKKALESQLIQSQKMESVGQLVGGIAHDFNNILMSVLGMADLIAMHDGADRYVLERADMISRASRRGQQMIAKLLSFARKGSLEKRPFDLNAAVENTVSIVERLLPKNIEISRRLHTPLPPVNGDIHQLEQVLLNLILNARDAVGERGEIRIATERIRLEAGEPRTGEERPPGLSVRLTVSDTGPGIPEDTLNRIFEPFFTTKEEGKGTGLGLAMAYGIVKSHGGTIRASNAADGGAVFEILLPAGEGGEAEGREAPPEPTEDLVTGTVLCIDDEKPVLDFLTDVLTTKGFTVLSTADPIQAMELYSRRWKEIDLVITDLVMPEMHGREVIEAVRHINPEARLLVISGFSQFTETLDPAGYDAFLDKPFTAAKLLRAVVSVLRPGRDSPA